MEAGCLPHVISIRLEGQAEHSNGSATDGTAAGFDDFYCHPLLTGFINLDYRFDDAKLDTCAFGDLGQCKRILREAGAAITRARMQKLATDPSV